jgi:hypothetical protein
MAAMSETLAAVMLLQDVADLAAQLITKPLIVDVERRRLRCEEVQQRLEAAISAGGAGVRYLDNFAPLLLHALDRALYRRQICDETGAVKWDAVVGHLLPHTRADAAAALASMKEAA